MSFFHQQFVHRQQHHQRLSGRYRGLFMPVSCSIVLREQEKYSQNFGCQKRQQAIQDGDHTKTAKQTTDGF